METSFRIEQVVNRGVNGDNFLHTTSKCHCLFVYTRIRLDPFFADLGRKPGAEPIPPKLNRFVADLDATLIQFVFDVVKRKRKPNVHHHCQADDLGFVLK